MSREEDRGAIWKRGGMWRLGSRSETGN